MSGLATAGFSFAAGCALAGYVLPADWLYYAAAALGLPFLGGLVLLRREARVRCAIICIFAAVGLVWYGLYSAAYLGTAAGFDGTTGCVTVRVGDYPYRDGNYAGVHVTRGGVFDQYFFELPADLRQMGHAAAGHRRRGLHRDAA